MLWECQKLQVIEGTYWTGGTSRMQCPKVPKVTAELRICVWLVSMTFRIAMSGITGAEIVVMRSSMDATKRKRTPTLRMSVKSRR